jgi:hypothetical protein
MEPTVNTLTTEHVNWIAGALTDGASRVHAMEFDATGERKIAAFEELVGRCEVKAYRLAMQLVGSESDAQEMVFILCDLEELSVEDGAGILDLSAAETKEHLQAARLAIRHAIGHYFSRGLHESASTSVCVGNDNRHLTEASLTDP